MPRLRSGSQNKDPDNVAYAVLVDGGESPAALRKALDIHKVGELDLLVLTHFDADHIGGLEAVWQHYGIATYWAPCLPAFQRHEWLFGDKVRRGMERARELEEGLAAAKTNVMYPLEGYGSAPLNELGPALHVLSPAARMIRTLLTSDDVRWLFTQTPTPLGWLGGPPPPVPVEQPANEMELHRQLLTGALVPEDLRWVRQSTVRPDADKVRLEWGASQNDDPEFFGDSILNNTSLVLWMDAVTGGRRHRILLTGDQENWTYLLMKHPLGMHADVMKAPHHGGRLYIENGAAHEEILSAVRPRALLFSANGRHHLPRAVVRESAIRWGASVFCTSERKKEIVAGHPMSAECCHDFHCCSEMTRDVVLELTAKGIEAELAACHSGYGVTPGPVIQIIQHEIQPSPVLQHLFEHELRQHIDWVGKQLHKIQTERARALAPRSNESRPVGADQLAAQARAAKRHVLAVHLPEVLSKGRERGKFWSAGGSGRHGDPAAAYALPSEKEVKRFITFLRTKELLLFAEAPSRLDQTTMLSELRMQGLAELCNAHLHFPEAVFEEAFWPATLTELKSWNCYRHTTGAFGLSQCAQPEELYAKLLRSMFAQSGDSWDLTREPKWSSAVVFTESGRPKTSWGRWWFGVDGDYYFRERVKNALAKSGIQLGGIYSGSSDPYLEAIAEPAMPAAAQIFGTLLKKVC